MVKRERFMNFLENNPVDRVPVAFFHHFCPPGEWGKGMEDQEVFKRNTIGHKLAREKFDPDAIKIMNDTLMTMPVDVSFVKTSDDLRKVQAPVSDSALVMKPSELTRRVRALHEDSDTPAYAIGFSPSAVLRNSLCIGGIPGEGDESRMLKFIDEAPDVVTAAMKNLYDGISAINEVLTREGGVDGIYMGVNNQSSFSNDDFYRAHMASYEREVIGSVNKLSKIDLLHIRDCHSRASHPDLFTDFEAAVANIAVYVGGASLSEGRKLFGGKLVLGGFAQDTVIYKGTEQEVKGVTWKILDECGQVGTMLGVDCTALNDIDDSRLEWVCQAAIEYAVR